jgi:hypothetical protein
MSESGSFRFGWDAPARISTSTVQFSEASEMLPLLYAPLPFPTDASGNGSNTGMATTPDGFPLWTTTPTRVDLVFWQGDDVVIPLYFNDPAVLGDDMAESFSWFAQIRACHSYHSTLVSEFSVAATYHAGDGTEATEYTQVEMFLARMYNLYAGIFQWEIYSIDSTADFSRFPKPDGAETWPPPDQLRTWLYGYCTILPRTSDTDYLYDGSVVPPSTGDGVTVAVGNGGFVVGPNGRVP